MDQIEVTSDVEAITVSGGDNLNTIGATVQTIEISCASVSLTASATSIDQVISATVETADVSGVSIDVITAAEQGPPGPPGPSGGTTSSDFTVVSWSTPSAESTDTIEITGSILDTSGSPVSSSIVDIDICVTDGAVDCEPSATAYLTAAGTPSGTVLGGSGTATLTIRSAAGVFAIAVHESAAAHRFLWIRAAGHERVWVRAADGVQELVFT